MRRRQLSGKTAWRLGLAGFVAGGVLAVLVNAGNAGTVDTRDDMETPPVQIDGPVELGRVAWLRDFGAGRAQARQTGKPILLLFQEVPG